ncbi:5371_t:CDS:2, partial [Racocetra persica]
LEESHSSRESVENQAVKDIEESSNLKKIIKNFSDEEKEIRKKPNKRLLFPFSSKTKLKYSTRKLTRLPELPTLAYRFGEEMTLKLLEKITMERYFIRGKEKDRFMIVGRDGVTAENFLEKYYEKIENVVFLMEKLFPLDESGNLKTGNPFLGPKGKHEDPSEEEELEAAKEKIIRD